MERVSPGQPLFSASITADLRCEPWDGTAPAALLQVIWNGRCSLRAHGTVSVSRGLPHALQPGSLQAVWAAQPNPVVAACLRCFGK